MGRIFFLSALVLGLFFSVAARAQYWQTFPPLEEDKGVSASFSNDDKRVFYMGKDPSGNKNVFSIEIKGGATIQTTRFTDAPVVRACHFASRPMHMVMKASAPTSTDYHMVRIADNMMDAPLDVTPDPEGIRNEIIGLSFNGKYLYYSSNKVNKAKTDYYRYDISQNISETVLANDKGFRVLAWSRDQERLLCQDPKTSEVLILDIQTVERKSLYSPIAPRKVISAALTPDNKQLYVLETDGTKNELRSIPMASPTEIGEDIKVVDESGTNRFVFSTNGKFLFLYKSGGLTIKEMATGAEYMPPIASAVDAITNPRENWLLVTKESPNGKTVQLTDVGKKTTVDLITIK
jgi:hypothetical protein